VKKTISILFVLALVLSFSLVATTPVAAATLTVNTGQPLSATNFHSIQAAVDAASPLGGDTIVVHAGTYAGTVNVAGFTGLTIAGVDKTQVTVKPSTTLDWNVGGYGGARKAVFRIVNSTGVVLQNMTMDFDLVKGNHINGILYWDSTGIVNNNILKNMSVPDAAGGYYEITSYYRADSYTPASRADITISGNTFIDTGRLGAVLHTYVHATITGNTFYKTTADFGYAIELGSEATGTISNNTIYGFNTAAASDGSKSAGIYVENAFTWSHVAPLTKNVAIIGNEVYDCQYGLYVGSSFPGYAGNVDIVLNLSNNSFHDNTLGGVVITDEGKSAGSSVNVSGGGNRLENNTGYGYYIFTKGNGDITVALTCEKISGHDTGVYVMDTAGGASTSSYSVSIEQSEIDGNSSYGMNNTVNTFVVDAENNWWGSDSGPYHSSNTDGTGNAVSDNADFTPWIKKAVATTATGTGPVLFSPSAGNILDLTPVAAPGLPSVTFPHGMFSFQICCLTPGQTVDLTVTLPSAVPVGTVWWKYDNGRWYSLPNLSDNGNHIMVIRLTDGGVGDSDGLVNGFITDPGGPGNPMTVGIDGSPVSKASILAPWIVLLAAMMAGVSLLVWRRRRVEI